MGQLGAVQTVVVCASSAFAQAPCPAGMAVTTIQGYIIDPSQASNIEAQNEPFDYATAAGIWSMGFTFVVGLYLVSKSAGIILNRIKG
jgi:hypothetical protein